MDWKSLAGRQQLKHLTSDPEAAKADDAALLFRQGLRLSRVGRIEDGAPLIASSYLMDSRAVKFLPDLPQEHRQEASLCVMDMDLLQDIIDGEHGESFAPAVMMIYAAIMFGQVDDGQGQTRILQALQISTSLLAEIEDDPVIESQADVLGGFLNRINLHRMRSTLWLAIGKHDLAIDELSIALKIDPVITSIRFSRAFFMAAFETKDRKLLFLEFRLAVKESHPDARQLPEAYAWMAKLVVDNPKLGTIEKARRYWRSSRVASARYKELYGLESDSSIEVQMQETFNSSQPMQLEEEDRDAHNPACSVETETRDNMPASSPLYVGCSVCNSGSIPDLFQCCPCKEVYYCSTSCQKKDWAEHRALCRIKACTNQGLSLVCEYNNARDTVLINPKQDATSKTDEERLETVIYNADKEPTSASKYIPLPVVLTQSADTDQAEGNEASAPSTIQDEGRIGENERSIQSLDLLKTDEANECPLVATSSYASLVSHNEEDYMGATTMPRQTNSAEVLDSSGRAIGEISEHQPVKLESSVLSNYANVVVSTNPGEAAFFEVQILPKFRCCGGDESDHKRSNLPEACRYDGTEDVGIPQQSFPRRTLLEFEGKELANKRLRSYLCARYSRTFNHWWHNLALSHKAGILNCITESTIPPNHANREETAAMLKSRDEKCAARCLTKFSFEHSLASCTCCDGSHDFNDQLLHDLYRDTICWHQEAERREFRFCVSMVEQGVFPDTNKNATSQPAFFQPPSKYSVVKVHRRLNSQDGTHAVVMQTVRLTGRTPGDIKERLPFEYYLKRDLYRLSIYVLLFEHFDKLNSKGSPLGSIPLARLLGCEHCKKDCEKEIAINCQVCTSKWWCCQGCKKASDHGTKCTVGKKTPVKVIFRSLGL